jgi:hypothetical protein
VTLSEAKTALSALGYDVVDIFAVKNGHAVFQDTAGNVRVKNLNDTRFRGLRGAFYDDHTGNGETALQAALNSIPGGKRKG